MLSGVGGNHAWRAPPDLLQGCSPPSSGGTAQGHAPTNFGNREVTWWGSRMRPRLRGELRRSRAGAGSRRAAPLCA